MNDLVIHKYRLPFMSDRIDTCDVKIPTGAFLHLAVQHRDVHVWAAVDPNSDTVTTRFHLVGTGRTVDPRWYHLGDCDRRWVCVARLQRAARRVRQPAMTALAGDELTAALIPLALDLITAIHDLNPAVVADILEHAAALTGDHLTAVRHLAVLCAGMGSEDHAAVASLGWTRDPAGYRIRRLTEDALTASLHAGQSPGKGAT
jgi:hypothetical protein